MKYGVAAGQVPVERKEERALGLMKVGTGKPKAGPAWANSDGGGARTAPRKTQSISYPPTQPDN